MRALTSLSDLFQSGELSDFEIKHDNKRDKIIFIRNSFILEVEATDIQLRGLASNIGIVKREYLEHLEGLVQDDDGLIDRRDKRLMQEVGRIAEGLRKENKDLTRDELIERTAEAFYS